jgi:hypothetical protein
MKTSLKICWFRASLAAIGLALTGWATSLNAQVVLTTTYENTFANAASVASYIYWYGIDYANTPMAWSTNSENGPSGGSLEVSIPWYLSNPTGDQAVFFGTFANTGPYSGGDTLSTAGYQSITLDVQVDPNSPTNQYGNYGGLQIGMVPSSWSGQAVFGTVTLPLTATNGWMHISVPIAPTVPVTNEAGFFMQIQSYGALYPTNQPNFSNNEILYIDNLTAVANSGPTYSNFISPTLQFDTTNDVAAIYGANNAVTGVTTSWYGGTNYVAWSTNDSKGNTNSGSLYISTQFTNNQNCDVLIVPFDTNYTGFADDTNVVINLHHYDAIELDVMWDTNNSTISIDEFNSQGDIDGFPIGTIAVPGTDGDESCGSTTTFIPDTASNGWVHIVCPIDNLAVADSQTIGVFLKKYVGESTNSGTVAYWVDNITFDGAVIPSHPNQAAMSIAKPALGLQCNFSGTAGNADYDREAICTANSTYSFVDAGTVTYSMTIAAAPPTATSSALIMLDQDGTLTEPDWDDPAIIRFVIQEAGTGGSSVTLQCKTNSMNSNGDLYDASDPTWTTTVSPVGKWSFTVSGNTNILVTAPDLSSTNLPFPLGFQSSDVESNFPASAGMYAYFGAEGGGGTSIGTRWVISQVSISGGTATALSEDWVAEANTGSSANGGEAGPAGSGGTALPGQNQSWTGSVSGVAWTDTSDSSTSRGLYLIGTNTAFVLDWTSVAGPGLNILTNATLLPTGWATNTTLTADSFLDGNFFSTEVDVTNLPPDGDLFFSLDN